MDAEEARRLVAGARVARLATRSARSGLVDLVPVTFVLLTDGQGDRLVTVVDHKPKTTDRLQRLANVRVDPEVTVLADHYDEDWTELWWVRLQGRAEVIEPDADDATRTEAVAALIGKYPQYRNRPPTGAALVVAVTGWRWWSATVP